MEKIVNALKFWKSFKPSGLRIYTSKGVFSHIDQSFKTISLPVIKGNSNVIIYGLVKNATFLEIFSSFNVDFNLLTVSEDTVVKMCMEYEKYLADEKERAFFYLGGNVVAKVNFFADGLHINYYDLNSDIIWNIKKQRWFIIPDINL
jgi:hypothetical protein